MSRLPTLLAVPGLGLGPEAWEPTLTRLRATPAVADGVEVLTLPGYGRPASAGADLSPEALARLVLAHRGGSVVLLGHSASCQLAVNAAAMAPERIAGLVLVGPTTDPRAASWRGLVARWLRTAVHETPRQVPSLVRQYSRTTLPVMTRAMDAARRDDPTGPLARAAVPTLVVRGHHDAISPQDWTTQLAGLGAPGSRAVTLPTGAHMVPLTHGPLLAETVATFLSDLHGRRERRTQGGPHGIPREGRLAEVARRIDGHVAHLERLSGARPWHVTDTENLDAGYPYYREEGGRLVLRANERGKVLSEEWTDDVDELVRLVMRSHVMEVATKHEARHRRRGEDSRRQWFALAEEWLGAMDPRWGELERAHHERILVSHPFRDK
ncbi:Imm63 family immunity protein [Rothia sp. ARF10]|nr:Imm63 family immunity protein [Rothia sp. ARF10]